MAFAHSVNTYSLTREELDGLDNQDRLIVLKRLHESNLAYGGTVFLSIMFDEDANQYVIKEFQRRELKGGPNQEIFTAKEVMDAIFDSI